MRNKIKRVLIGDNGRYFNGTPEQFHSLYGDNSESPDTFVKWWAKNNPEWEVHFEYDNEIANNFPKRDSVITKKEIVDLKIDVNIMSAEDFINKYLK